MVRAEFLMIFAEVQYGGKATHMPLKHHPEITIELRSGPLISVPVRRCHLPWGKSSNAALLTGFGRIPFTWDSNLLLARIPGTLTYVRWSLHNLCAGEDEDENVDDSEESGDTNVILPEGFALAMWKIRELTKVADLQVLCDSSLIVENIFQQPSC